MTLGTAVDSNVLSYPVLVFMKEQGTVVGRGRACPRTLDEVELALSRRTRRSLSPWGSGEAEPIFRRSGKKCSSVLV